MNLATSDFFVGVLKINIVRIMYWIDIGNHHYRGSFSLGTCCDSQSSFVELKLYLCWWYSSIGYLISLRKPSLWSISELKLPVTSLLTHAFKACSSLSYGWILSQLEIEPFCYTFWSFLQHAPTHPAPSHQRNMHLSCPGRYLPEATPTSSPSDISFISQRILL